MRSSATRDSRCRPTPKPEDGGCGDDGDASFGTGESSGSPDDGDRQHEDGDSGAPDAQDGEGPGQDEDAGIDAPPSHDPSGAGEVMDTAAEEQAWDEAMHQALNIARTEGKAPGRVEETVRDAHASTLDWRTLLRHTMTDEAKSDYSWSLPNRRFIDSGLYLPSIRSESLDTIAVIVDTSDSLPAETLAEFWAELREVTTEIRPERVVEQRLRLGNAAPELLDAYQADKIDLEVLNAFAVTADCERQMAVWEQVSGQGHRPSAWRVKRLLTEERVPGASAVARFVGVEAYEAAGGTVMRDLFADEHEHGVWFEDPVLLEMLAMAKLQAAAAELSTRWKWAVPMIETAWSDTASCGRIEP